MNAAPGPFRWTVDEYEKMIRHGILTESHNVELIRGEIVPKMSKGDFHTYALRELVRLFSELASSSSTLSIQDPIRLSDSEPEPDLVLLVKCADKYRGRKQSAADALLVIEVADSSLSFDRDNKGPLYAENGVREYWVVNIPEHCVEVYREPQTEGKFAKFEKHFSGEKISLLLLPQVSINVSDLF